MSLIEKVAKRLDKKPRDARSTRSDEEAFPFDGEDESYSNEYGSHDDYEAADARGGLEYDRQPPADRMADLDNPDGYMAERQTVVSRRQQQRPSPLHEAPYAAHCFDLDFMPLESKGIISPQTTNERHARDVRAIKRRLLARMKFFSAGKGTPGIERRDAGRGDARRENKVLVTSSSPGEGKTFFALNLALSLVIEERANVLLIDADLPRASLTALLGLENQGGLTDKLMSPSMDISEVLIQENSLPMMFMPRGSQIPSAITLFNSEATPDLLQRISHRFRDYLVIIDTPPMLASAGTDIMAKYADQVAFLVEAGVTKESTVVSAVELLPDTEKVNLVLNKSFTADETAHFGNLYGYYGYYPHAPVQPEDESR